MGVGGAAPRSTALSPSTCSRSVYTRGQSEAGLCVLVAIATTSVPASQSQQAVTHARADKWALDVHTDSQHNRGVFLFVRLQKSMMLKNQSVQ